MAHFSKEQPLLLLGLSALGYVAGDLRRADHLSLGVPERRYRQRDFNQASILAPADGFKMVDALATSNAFNDRRFFIGPIRGNQDRDRPAEHFFRPVTEEPFCAFVPARDDAVEVLGHNGVV